MSEQDLALLRFWQLCAPALHEDAGLELQLSAPTAQAGDLQRLLLRPVQLKQGRALQLVFRHATKDITRNLSPDEALAVLQAHLGPLLRAARLQGAGGHWQLDFNRKGRARLVQHSKGAAPAAAAAGHNREKTRWLHLEEPVWQALCLAQIGRGGEVELVPAMARKWRQINHFVEIFDAGLRAAGLNPGQPVRVADFGCGKAYLTFAVHEHLRRGGWLPQVRGVELRQELVDQTETIARRLGLEGLSFSQGDVGHEQVQPLDVMIALHACDTATDHALHHGLRAGARLILSAPCCHKQLRGQLQPPGVLRPLFKHGVHLGQEAEMLTDGLRALLLESQGYDTQVFEFIALEHTQKNKMIQAVRRAQPSAERQQQATEQARALKDFWGVREQALERLLVGQT
ncbi:class I SAM-dependent methyltransferase [Inhella proteolytica]|uniref:SAM-dependent methyltransferase n=1 Tax=Inhella proteolytica TaxID=2795029 RepID=A0A931J2I0_9BURK|nr:SAM-dependent methyltransferase [Inhella proteolytica]MBH9577553.1 SAM-dependent methyltransferase [Inhella proteolytica]